MNILGIISAGGIAMVVGLLVYLFVRGLVVTKRDFDAERTINLRDWPEQDKAPAHRWGRSNIDLDLDHNSSLHAQEIDSKHKRTLFPTPLAELGRRCVSCGYEYSAEQWEIQSVCVYCGTLLTKQKTRRETR